MFFNWNMHDDIDELYDDRHQKKWESVKLMSRIHDVLGKYNNLISDIEIFEDYKNHQTIIKIVINEQKYLIERMVDFEFNFEKTIYDIIINRFTLLNPLIKITIE